MEREQLIDQLAHEVNCNLQRGNGYGVAFSDLYEEIRPQFESIVRNYMIRHKLQNFNFDYDCYYSALGRVIEDAVKQYDITKGHFISRVVFFADKRLGNVTRTNLSKVRFDKHRATYSFENLHGTAEVQISDCCEKLGQPTCEQLINEFIAADKDGSIIDILRTFTESKSRGQALRDYFGGCYDSAQRKRVQRVKERLQIHLKSNGVCI